MCEECGCGLPGPTKIDGKPAGEIGSPLIGHESPGAHTHSHPHGHDHDHPHAHPHEHEHQHSPHQTIEIHQSVFAANDRLAERNRGFFSALGLLVLNVLSSPGSGKTTFVQKTIEKLGKPDRIGVIVGDLETDNDARRLRTSGADVVQITTGTLCHLDAEMVARALGNLNARELDMLFIENVGNLVCPSSFDLGEGIRVAILSVTEGEDKPLKYPPLFHSAHVVIISKIDLAAAVEFDRETALANITRVNPGARVFEVSAKKDQGMDAWCDYLKELQKGLIAAPRP
jgi:hydrogenase nickel incorporation protein HypB